MNQTIDCTNDSRALLEFVDQAVIRSGITNLTVNYLFFAEIDDPDAEPYAKYSYSGLAKQFENTMRQYPFIFKFHMNAEIQRVEIDPDRDLCYIEIWV